MASPPEAVLLLGALYRDPLRWQEAARILESRFGPLEEERLEFPFANTDYYRAEMGHGLVRLFCSFRDPVRQDSLAGIKTWTNRLEADLADGEGGNRRRCVNLDPGLLALDKVVLATTKEYSHRIYLGEGIYAELALICRGAGFRPLHWTYPDYRRREALDFFNRLRVHWRHRLRGEAP